MPLKIIARVRSQEAAGGAGGGETRGRGDKGKGRQGEGGEFLNS